ncbi:alcohol dehydrogenase [Babesia caballi]|uniref:Alcohol dehydrogenase n=1 Tax=Babesia caballi TaxID=5871 RepID=A0AAV4LQU5_BABCB|nr:alcohol dehydrogenase [Babesia caballi]
MSRNVGVHLVRVAHGHVPGPPARHALQADDVGARGVELLRHHLVRQREGRRHGRPGLDDEVLHDGVHVQQQPLAALLREPRREQVHDHRPGPGVAPRARVAPHVLRDVREGHDVYLPPFRLVHHKVHVEHRHQPADDLQRVPPPHHRDQERALNWPEDAVHRVQDGYRAGLALHRNDVVQRLLSFFASVALGYALVQLGGHVQYYPCRVELSESQPEGVLRRRCVHGPVPRAADARRLDSLQVHVVTCQH